MTHPDVSGAQVWVQKTTVANFHFGDPDYWYAFAGDPNRTPGGSSAPFSDIAGSPFYDHIVWLVEEGITGGCGNGQFCPNSTVRRNQMASFLARALDLPAAEEDYFDDDDGQSHEADINKLAAAGITGGCGERQYCPTAPVNRDEMASFVSRALAFADTEVDFFVDDTGNTHERNINRFAGAGVTTGCAASMYCPNSTVTRGQMAAFLHRALG
jgi:hypothetical protein